MQNLIVVEGPYDVVYPVTGNNIGQEIVAEAYKAAASGLHSCRRIEVGTCRTRALRGAFDETSDVGDVEVGWNGVATRRLPQVDQPVEPRVRHWTTRVGRLDRAKGVVFRSDRLLCQQVEQRRLACVNIGSNSGSVANQIYHGMRPAWHSGTFACK